MVNKQLQIYKSEKIKGRKQKETGKYAYIDYRQLAAQAMQLLYKNERYGLNDENEKVLWQNNIEFE